MHFFRYFIFSVFIFFSVPVYLSLAVLLTVFFLSSWKKEMSICIASLFFLASYTSFFWPDELPFARNNQAMVVRGVIETEPVMKGHYSQFAIKVRQCGQDKTKCFYRFLISNYKKTAVFHSGDTLSAVLKVKQFRDYQTPGSLAYSALQRAKGFSGKGYLLKILTYRSSTPSLLFRVRQKLLSITKVLYKQPFANALMASLLIGDRQGLSRDDRQTFQLTGTSHLIAISGLHVGLIAVVSFFLVSFLWRRFAFLCECVAAHRVGAFAALLAAFFYSLLSGFAIPTQRAFLMSLVFLSAKLFNKKTNVWHSYLLAMCLVLMVNPFSVFFAGFYLSFLAVFILIWFSNPSKWFFVTVQLKIWLLMMPVSLYFFKYYSLLSIPANLLAIPLVSFIILPLGFASVFLSVVSNTLAGGVSLVISFCIKGLNLYLHFLLTFDFLGLYFSLTSIWTVLISTVLLFYSLCARQWKVGCISLFVIGLLFYPYRNTVKEQEAMISVLDVGQGLSVLIETKTHALLYDTGGRFSSGFNLGDAVIVPFLMHQGIYHLNAVVVSHEDMDHRGGFEAITKKIRIDKTYRNGKAGFDDCHHAKGWTWDGVHFYFLPIKSVTPLSQNNKSCVLMIDNDVQRALLPGDIEASTERLLLESDNTPLKAALLISPHHGSKTSSSPPFLKAVAAKVVVISSGFNNRYHLPNASVVKRYNGLGINTFNTAYDGYFQWRLPFLK